MIVIVFFNILDKPLKERREILAQHMTPIENRILLSDLKMINKKSELKHLINFTIAEGLEGLVLKVNMLPMGV
jgi:ATP-dependent DNA ligase